MVVTSHRNTETESGGPQGELKITEVPELPENERAKATEKVQRQALTGGGKALNELGGTPAYQTQSNSEYLQMKPGSKTVGDKLHSRKGNNPAQQLRRQNNAQWKGSGISLTMSMLA